jgi:uncharacterized protein YbjQ (UPF0145 family)
MAAGKSFKHVVKPVSIGWIMKKVNLFAALVFWGMASCVPPTTSISALSQDYSEPVSGTFNNAGLAVKDYEIKGIIFVNSTATVNSSGERTGSKITYEMLMKKAQKLGADDIINVRIDVRTNVRTEQQEKPNSVYTRTVYTTIYNYTATALAISYTQAVAGAGGTEAGSVGLKNDMETGTPPLSPSHPPSSAPFRVPLQGTSENAK